MEKIAVYNCREDEKQLFDEISKKYNFQIHAVQNAPYEYNIAETEGCRYVSVTSDSVLTTEVLEGFAHNGVQHIASRTIGLDHIPLKEAEKLGITVSNVSYSASSVADYAIMLMLMVYRRVKPLMLRAAGNDYRIMPGNRGQEIVDKTVGIIGTGNIGRTLARHLQGFPVRLIACDLFPSEDLKGIAEYVSMEELLRQSDIISLHVPVTQKNYHLIDQSTISKMKKGVVLINTARGALIDSDALIDGLESGQIAGAGLDVIEGDREIYYRDRGTDLVKNHEMAVLNSFSNVILLPHMAFYTDNAVYDMVENAIINCKDHRDN